jgi:2-polyprenyl-3-methyl-5-hydroxy-6-metoxy-1,4-benzoquinol methylase
MLQLNRFSSCLICNSTQLQNLEGYEANYLVKCKSCNFVFCERKPSEQELVNHYLLYSRGTSISSITIHRYEQLLDEFERFRKTNNILDIGCGDGHFLEVAKARNWNVYGTEFTTEAIQVVRKKGIKMKLGSLDPNNYENDFFDVVTSFEVIEHINNPVDEIRAIKMILRTGGLVYLTTPNFNSVSRNIVGANWNVIEYPEHLSYYTRSTIQKLFSTVGLKALKISTTGISLNRISRSIKPKNSFVKPTYDESFREKSEKDLFFRFLKMITNFNLNLLNKGDTIKAFFIKN